MNNPYNFPECNFGIHILGLLEYARKCPNDMSIRRRAKTFGHPKSVQDKIVSWVHEYRKTKL
jgi:hypothetical protein